MAEPIVAGVMERLEAKVDSILTLLQTISRKESQILQREIQMSTQLDQLTAQVQATTDIEESAIVLIKGLIQQIKDAGTDQVKLDALTANLKDKTDALAAALVANT